MTLNTPSLFDSMEQDDTQRRVASRRCLAIAHNKIEHSFGNFLRGAKSEEDFHERLAIIQDDFAWYVKQAAEHVGYDSPEHTTAALRDHYLAGVNFDPNQDPANSLMDPNSAPPQPQPQAPSGPPQGDPQYNSAPPIPQPPQPVAGPPQVQPQPDQFMQPGGVPVGTPGSPQPQFGPGSGGPPQQQMASASGRLWTPRTAQGFPIDPNQPMPGQDPNQPRVDPGFQRWRQQQAQPWENVTPEQITNPTGDYVPEEWQQPRQGRVAGPHADYSGDRAGLMPQDVSPGEIRTHSPDHSMANGICPECGNLVDPGSPTCPNCGYANQPSPYGSSTPGMIGKTVVAEGKQGSPLGVNPSEQRDTSHAQVTCPDCGGTGRTANRRPCRKCGGRGKIQNFGDSVLDAVAKVAEDQNNTGLGGPEFKMDKGEFKRTKPEVPGAIEEKDILKTILPANTDQPDHELKEIGDIESVDLPSATGMDESGFAEPKVGPAPHTDTFGKGNQTTPVTRESLD